MTCNQLILLLNVYRGTMYSLNLVDTFDTDKKYLTSKNWITCPKEDLQMTTLGRSSIRLLMDFLEVHRHLGNPE